MGLEHPEEKIDVIGRLRDFESASRTGICASLTGICLSLLLRIRKSDRECELARDEIDAVQSKRELLKEPPEDEEQRLRGLDLMIELKTFLKNFRGLNKF